MKIMKTILIMLLIITAISLTACTSAKNISNSPFPGVDDADIPDILETTVGNLGNVYYSAGITNAPDYKSVLTVTFEDTTEADYDTLMEHYKSESTGTDENNALLFEWGMLQESSNNNSITINALIK